MMIRSLLISAVLSSAFAIVAAPAMAQEETTSVAVSYADLNLQTHAGVAALERRITRAVDEVCGSGENSLDLNDWFGAKKCRTEALRDAHDKMSLAIAAASAPTHLAALAPSLTVRP